MYEESRNRLYAVPVRLLGVQSAVMVFYGAEGLLAVAARVHLHTWSGTPGTRRKPSVCGHLYSLDLYSVVFLCFFTEKGMAPVPFPLGRMFCSASFHALLVTPAVVNLIFRARPLVRAHEQGKKYSFKRVFGEEATQEMVFEGAALPLVDGVCTGVQNSLLVMYGMSGGGKTHTTVGTEDDMGLLPRALR